MWVEYSTGGGYVTKEQNSFLKWFILFQNLTANVLRFVGCVAVLYIFIPSLKIWRSNSGEIEDYEAV
jgi:hypothetical protein